MSSNLKAQEAKRAGRNTAEQSQSRYWVAGGVFLWLLAVAGMVALSFFALVAVVVATGYFIIGWKAFLYLLRFHRNVILGSGLYGTGNQVVVSGEGIWRAITARLKLGA